MSAVPPKYRPLERFWPYADLPEQPTDEELASLDPDLHEALFGANPRPFSITLSAPSPVTMRPRTRPVTQTMFSLSLHSPFHLSNASR